MHHRKRKADSRMNGLAAIGGIAPIKGGLESLTIFVNIEHTRVCTVIISGFNNENCDTLILDKASCYLRKDHKWDARFD